MRFAEKCERELDKIDAVLENAGISTEEFRMAEGNEVTITTNVLSTFFLALLLLPKLRAVATKYNINPRITIVGSEVHAFAPFKERHSAYIFDTLSDPKQAKMKERYFLSKLLVMLAFREMSERMRKSGKEGSRDVVLNTVAPGWCYSDLFREDPAINTMGMRVAMRMFARTTEEGSRCLVGAVVSGSESHGQYLNDGKIKP